MARRRPGSRLLLACALLVAGSALAAADDPVEGGFVFKKLERTINLKAPIVVVADAIAAQAASTSGPPPSRVLLCYTRALADRLAYLELEVEGKAQSTGWARVSNAELASLFGAPDGGNTVGCFAVPLGADAQRALAGGKEAKLAAYASFARALEPRPPSAPQDAHQLLLFRDAALRAVSPYRVEAQAVDALTPARPLSFSPGAPTGALKSGSAPSGGGAALRFEPTGPTEPWGALAAPPAGGKGGKGGKGGDKGGADNGDGLSVHFRLDEPLLRARRVVREVQVSHWGNAYVEESYLVRNDGPALLGEFSRRRYSDRSAHRPHMFENLRARLPQGARWIYFRDAIGNVSTSEVHRLPASGSKQQPLRDGKGRPISGGGVVVDLGVRYPMLGGWEVDFVLGYSLPLHSVLSRVVGAGGLEGGGKAGGGKAGGGKSDGGSNGRLRLRVPLPPPIEGMYTDELEVRVVLPEGATDVAHAAPSAPNAEASLERKRTYLDTPGGQGRPVLVLRLPNAVPDHRSARLTVEYTLPAYEMLRKPLLLVFAYGLVFAALAFCSRADFSIVGGGGGKAKTA